VVAGCWIYRFTRKDSCGSGELIKGVGFLGPIGFGISATHFILDATTAAFGGFGETKP
jgi:hypothetical protein